jgi:hypothetical protein
MGGDIGRPCLFILILALLASAAAVKAQPSSQPVSPPKTLHVTDKFGVEKAMRAGDTHKLKAISRKNLTALMKDYALAAYYRSGLNISKSSKYARDCYEAEDAKVTSRTVVRLVLCGTLLAGNYLLSGHITDWANTLLSMRNRTHSFVSHAVHTSNFIYPYYGGWNNLIPMKKFSRFPTTEVIDSSSGAFSIARVQYSSEHKKKVVSNVYYPDFNPDGASPYYIKLSINGHNVKAAFDTGNTITRIAPSAVSALGIHVKPANFYSLSRGGRTVPAHLGYAKHVELSVNGKRSFKMRNADVMIGGKKVAGHSVVLGMNVISRLGSILIEKDKIVVHPEEENIKCTTPFSIASPPVGAYKLLLDFPVDGRSRHIALDTGSNVYLSGTAKVKHEQTKRRMTHSISGVGIITRPYYLSRSIHFGQGANAKDLKIRVFPKTHRPFSFIMGSPILRDFNIYLNFAKGEGCLLPKRQ